MEATAARHVCAGDPCWQLWLGGGEVWLASAGGAWPGGGLEGWPLLVPAASGLRLEAW